MGQTQQNVNSKEKIIPEISLPIETFRKHERPLVCLNGFVLEMVKQF